MLNQMLQTLLLFRNRRLQILALLMPNVRQCQQGDHEEHWDEAGLEADIDPLVLAAYAIEVQDLQEVNTK